ncbi:hydrogenase expression/formation protein HypD [Bradyrhizobium sp. LM3.6]
MEFCGGHTHTISRYGLEDMLPKNVRMIHGPGCPVCVLPAGRIDMAIRLAERPDVILCVYGDLMRVPGSQGASLLKAKARGADVRMVYSTIDAIRVAEEIPGRAVVFFAIGFETTTPPTAAMIRLAEKKQLKNFSVFCNHVLTPPAMQNILESADIRNIGRVEIDGLRRAGPRLDHHRHRALRVLCRRIRQAGGDRGLRAARHDAGDPDAGAAGQRAPK